MNQDRKEKKSDAGRKEVRRQYEGQEKGSKSLTSDSYWKNSGSSPPDERKTSDVEDLPESQGDSEIYISPARRRRQIIRVDFQKLERYPINAPKHLHNSTHRNPKGRLTADLTTALSVSPEIYDGEDEATEKKQGQVWEIVRRLAPQQRKVVVLLFGLDGEEPKPQQEVAEILGISQQTVSEYWKAARKKFSKTWVKNGFPLRERR